MLYSIFIISSYKYREYKVNQNIQNLVNQVIEIKSGIIDALNTIEYKKSPAYINKILKEEQWFKNKWETVIYLTPEKKYNKFTKDKIIIKEDNLTINKENDYKTTKYMTIFRKWLYFLFNTSK